MQSSLVSGPFEAIFTARMRRQGLMKLRYLLWGLVLFSLSSCQLTPPREPAAISVQPTEPAPFFVCSFNIQFLGNSRTRQNQALAQILAEQGCDIVAVQELLAPPDLTLLPGSEHFRSKTPVTFPGGKPLKPKDNVTDFFQAMHQVGFDGFILSEEDTGKSTRNRTNSSASEWWVTFFQSSKVVPAPELPQGFLSAKVAANPHWDRVPYAFGFRSVEGAFDFVLISVHLRPDTGPANRKRRAEELHATAQWIRAQQESHPEKDYVILGDMNIYNEAELSAATPEGFISLNTAAQFATNTNVRNPFPYDHVMVAPLQTPEIPTENNFVVLNLLELAKKYWQLTEPYPGYPSDYQHDKFRAYFSDHHPVGFFVYPTNVDSD